MTAKPLNPTAITKRLRAAGVPVLHARAFDLTWPTTDAGVVEVVGRVWVSLTVDAADHEVATATALLQAAGYVVEVTTGLRGRRDGLDVTLPAAPAAEVVDLTVVEAEPAPAAEPALQLAAFPLPEVAGQLDLLDVEVDEHLADEPAVELIVVTCTGPKLDEPAPAGQLYTGASHKLPREAAAAIAERTGARVAIVSALHGLLDLDQLVAPYEQQLGKPGAVEAATVAGQLLAAGVRRVVALVSNPYAALLAEAAELAGVELVHPLAGCRGIGEQRGRLARLRDGRPLAA